jgi:CRP/FNR family transcriptional regulator, cAMP and macrophage regulator
MRATRGRTMAATRVQQVSTGRAARSAGSNHSSIMEQPSSPPTGEPLLDERELLELAGTSGLVRMEAGSVLVTEGVPVEAVYLIRSGEVEIYRKTSGRRMVMQILRPGDFLGLVAHLRGRPPLYSARAITPVQALRLRPEALTWLLQSRPSVSRRFLVYLAAHLERMARRVEELSGAGLGARVAALLLDQTEDGRRSIRLPQSLLAELLGASRSSVNRVLKGLEAQGMVRVRYRRIEVLDAAAIRRLTR